MKYYFSLPKLFALVLIILLNSILSVSMAQTAIPPLNNGVMDSANALKASEKSKLDEKIMQFERESGSQIAVLIIPQLNNEDIVDYGIRVMEEWKLGRKDIDDGVLLIISVNDRKMRLEVGYGLEGAIPDITAAKILNEYLAPHFKNQNYYQGINQATYAIIALIKQEPLPPVQAKPKNDGDILGWIMTGVAILIICGVFLLYAWVIFSNLKDLFSKPSSQCSYSSNDDQSYHSYDSSDSGYSRDSDSSSSSSSDDRSSGGGRSGGGGATGGW